MAIGDLVKPWQGEVYRSIPEGPAASVLETKWSALSKTNRWNEEGEHTLYFAKDQGVIAAEWARYLRVERTPTLARQTRPRAVWRCTLATIQIIDLCDPITWSDLSLQDTPFCFLDKLRARTVARFLRYHTQAQGLRVPSMAFLDDLAKWDLVLFREKLPAADHAFALSVVREGTLKYEMI